MAEGEADKKEPDSKKIVHTYPLVKNSDMPEEMKQESVELVVTACEKHAANNEAAAKMIKDQMDKKFGPPFHVVVGEGFGFEIYTMGNYCFLIFCNKGYTNIVNLKIPENKQS